jgi:hypothetical protein
VDAHYDEAHHFGVPTSTTNVHVHGPLYSIPLAFPHLHLSQTPHSSSSKRRVIWAMVKDRLKTHVFLSSQRVRVTSMMNGLVVFHSAAANRATAAGHHSRISVFIEGTMLGNRRRVTTPVQMASAKGHCRVRWSRVSSLDPHKGHMMCVGSPLLRCRSAVQHR